MALEGMYIENGNAPFATDKYSLQYAIGTHPIYQRLMKRRKDEDAQTFNEVSNDFETSDSTEIINSHEGDHYQAPLEYQIGDIPDIIVTDYSESVELAEVPFVEVEEVSSSIDSSKIHTDNDFTKNMQLNSKLHINQTDTNRLTPNKELRETIKDIRISISEDRDTETNEPRRRFTVLQNQIRKEITSSVKILRTLFESKKSMASCDPKLNNGEKRKGTTSKDDKIQTKYNTIHTIPEEIENNHKVESLKTDDKHETVEASEQKQELTTEKHVFQNTMESELNMQNHTDNIKDVKIVNQQEKLTDVINQSQGESNINDKELDQSEELQLTENYLCLNYLFNIAEEAIEKEKDIIEEDYTIIEEEDGTIEEEYIIKEQDTIKEQNVIKEQESIKEKEIIEEQDKIEEKDNRKLPLIVYEKVNKLKASNLNQVMNQEMIESKLTKPKCIDNTQNFLKNNEHENILENIHQKSIKNELIKANENDSIEDNLGKDNDSNISNKSKRIMSSESECVQDNSCNDNNLHTSNHTQDVIEPDQKEETFEKNLQKISEGVFEINHYNDYEINCKLSENNQYVTDPNSNKKINQPALNEDVQPLKEQNKYDDLARQLQQLLKSESMTKNHGDYTEELTEEDRIQNLFQEVFLKWDEIEFRLLNNIGSTDHIYEEKMFQEMYEKLSEDKSEMQDTMSDRCTRTDPSKKSKFQTQHELSLKRYKSEAQLYDHHDLVLPKRKDNTLISKIYLQLGMVDKKNSNAKSRWDDNKNRGNMRMNRPPMDHEPIKIRKQYQSTAGETRIYLENKRNRRISLGRFLTVQDIHALEKRKIVQNILSKSQFQERKI